MNSARHRVSSTEFLLLFSRDGCAQYVTKLDHRGQQSAYLVHIGTATLATSPGLAVLALVLRSQHAVGFPLVKSPILKLRRAGREYRPIRTQEPPVPLDEAMANHHHLGCQSAPLSALAIRFYLLATE
jgi:hypothetical protein